MIATFARVGGRFGLNPKEAERFFKFMVVGAIGFVVDFGLFNLLTEPFNQLLSVGAPLYTFTGESGLGPGFGGHAWLRHLPVQSHLSPQSSVISSGTAIGPIQIHARNLRAGSLLCLCW